MSTCDDYDPAYLAVQVIDTINGNREVQHVRGDGKHEQKFEGFVHRYKHPQYIVQIIDNKTDTVIKDNRREL